VNNTHKQNPAGNAKDPGGMLADGDHAISYHPLARGSESIIFACEHCLVNAIPAIELNNRKCSSSYRVSTFAGLGMPEIVCMAFGSDGVHLLRTKVAKTVS
jgi:hypothetical protein